MDDVFDKDVNNRAYEKRVDEAAELRLKNENVLLNIKATILLIPILAIVAIVTAPQLAYYDEYEGVIKRYDIVYQQCQKYGVEICAKQTFKNLLP